MRKVYLDHQSATPVLPEVIEAMRPWFAEWFENPASLHQQGVRAREAMEAAREQVAHFINAESPENILFTSDATESANLALKGTAYANQKRGNHIIVSAIEHPSILNSLQFLEKHGFTATRVKVDGAGFIDPSDIQAAITDKTILIAVHLANHDIGTIQPIREISDLAGKEGITLYIDADAAAGWRPIDVQGLGAGLVSFSPQRFYGPKGVGVLYRNRRARLTSLLHGGEQENGLRAGIENIPAIVGAGAACDRAARDGAAWSAHCLALQKRLWAGLQTISHVRLNGPLPGPLRAPGNLNVSTAYAEGESQVLLCDMSGIAISGAMGCVNKSLTISPVLRAIGLEHEMAHSAVILSPGKDNTVEDIDYVIATFVKIIHKLRGMSPAWNELGPERTD